MRYLICLVFVLSACTSKRVLDNNVQEDTQVGLKSELIWYKVKNKKMDFLVRLTSTGGVPILIEANAFEAQLNGVKSGSAIKTNYREVIYEGDMRDYVISVRQSNAPEKGPGQLTIKNLYSHKNGKKGKALKNIVHKFTFGSRR